MDMTLILTQYIINFLNWPIFLMTIIMFGLVVGMAISMTRLRREISKRKKIELELRASQAEFRNYLETQVIEKANELQKSLQIQALLNKLPGLVYHIDNNCTPESFNDIKYTGKFFSDSCLALTGHNAKDFVTNKITLIDLIHVHDLKHVEQATIQAIQNKKPYELTYRIISKTGQLKWVWEQGQCILDKNDKLVAFEGIISDITELKQTEIALLQAKQVAETANQAKSIFLASMSHELRTPLNGILGYAQILQHDSSITTEQRQDLNVIEQSGNHLLALINDILDLAKVESGKIELYKTDFNLLSLLTSISETFKVKTQNSGINFYEEFANGLPNTVHGDEQRLRQILLNLLGNAVKFTVQGSITFKVNSKKLIVKSTKQAQQFQLIFSIQDTGVGISPENLATIFEPFKQVGEKEHFVNGTGLGLAISKNLVELMEGQLNVSSQINVGTQFRFAITLSIADYNIAKISSQQQIIGVKGESPKILVVDDNLVNLTLVTDLLSPLGFNIKSANDGHKGLEIASQWEPDVIITDLIMPEMDGFELICQLRLLPILKDKIIIASSANAYEDDKKRSLTVGSNAFLPKPVQITMLLNQLQHLLNLTWIYGDKIPETIVENNAANMVLPPIDELEKLYELSLLGDINELEEQVTILADDVKLKPFVTQMRIFLKNYQLKKLLKWFEKVMQNDQ